MHKLILKHTLLFLMLDTVATFLANTQAKSQAHTLFMLHTSATFKPMHKLILKLSVAVHYLAAGPRSRSRWGAVRVWVPSPLQQAAPPLPGPAAGRGDNCSRCRDRKTRRSTGMSALSCCSSTSLWHLQQMKDGGDKHDSWCRRSFCGERVFYISFFNKGAVLRPVQKCHSVMVLSQVTLCGM